MPVDHGGRQLHRPGVAQRLRVLVESDEQAVLPHDRLEERVVCGHLGLEERAAPAPPIVVGHGRGHARQQLGRGLARKGQPEDAFRGHALLDQADDATGHRIRLAAAGAGDDQYIAADRRADDRRLLGAVGECRSAFAVHACLVSNTVSTWPAQAGQDSFKRHAST